MRACWDAADTTGTMGPPEDARDDPVRIPLMAVAVGAGNRPVRTFVPVDSLSAVADPPGRTATADAARGTDVADAARDPYPGLEVIASGGARVSPRVMPARRIPGYWSLWGDFEP